eukprot:s1246_g15.t1
MSSVSEQAARQWIRSATPPSVYRLTLQIPTGQFANEAVINDVLQYLPIPADTKCSLNDHILPIKFPHHHSRPPALQDLAEAWMPWDESLGLGFQYGLVIGDQSLYRRCALQLCDLPFQRVVTMSDPPHGPLADVSLWLIWPPMSDLLYEVNALTNRVRELETNLSREHHARGNLEQSVATLRADQAILIESICAGTPALAACFGNWR